MTTPESLSWRVDPEEYNYREFHTGNFIYDVRATLARQGVAPGDPAPDFELPAVDGSRVRLSDLRGKPVVLHFGSPT
jgi:cytochrome oxidase Cu insertion factor (SCO1/SenC/PrrC family)